MSGIENPEPKPSLGRQIAPHLYAVPVVRELVKIEVDPGDDFLDNVVELPKPEPPEDLVA